jgi:predicted nucleotidyltransferase
MPRSHEVTLLDVIQAVNAVTVNDEETIATVVHLISSGQVRLSAETISAMMDMWATMDAAA